jgi:hypothetical protein
MDNEEYVCSVEMHLALRNLGFTQDNDEGRLMLAELMMKAGAGYYNSHTEEKFMNSFDLMRKDRTPNKKGRRFLCSLFYTHSNRRPEGFKLMQYFRDAG